MSWQLLALVLATDPHARAVDVSGGFVYELRGGRAPRNTEAESEPSVLTSLAPVGRLHYQDRVRSSRLLLQYSPRVLYRFPNQAELQRPLLLHSADLQYSLLASPNWDFTASSGLQVGQIDYSSARLVFGDTQTSAPRATVVSYLSSTTGLSLTGRIRPQHQILVASAFTFRTPIGADADPLDDAMGAEEGFNAVFPRQIGFNLSVGHAYLITARDTLTATIASGFQDFDNRGAILNLSGAYAWARVLTPRLNSQLQVGGFVPIQTREPQFGGQTLRGARLIPTTNAALQGRLLNRSNVRLTGNFGFGTSAFFDPLVGEVVPQLALNAGLTAFLPPQWSVGANASFSTSATREPRTFGDADEDTIDFAAQQETVISGRTPITYTFRRNYAFEFGTIFSGRGPHLTTDDFEFRAGEFWLYVAFRADYGTGHVRRRATGGGGGSIYGGQN